jgi:hypothetical protein
LTKHRRYVVLGCAKKYSTITTSFNVHDVLNCELTKIAMVKNNTEMTGEKISGDFE